MECPKCKKELVISDRVYRNLETYSVGGAKLIASECCNSGFIVKMKVSYQITEYTGEREEDDWGNKIKVNDPT